MWKKFCAYAFAVIIILAGIMFAEYRFVMRNIKPYYADGYVFVEFMGQTDRYDADPFFVEE